MGFMNKFRRQIAKIEEKIKELQAKKDSLQIEMMVSCEHPLEEIVMVRFGSHYSNSSPYRLCRLCGYGEDDWTTGIWLKHAQYKDLPEISGKKSDEYRTRHYHCDDMSVMKYPEREEHKKKAADPWIKPFLKPERYYVK